MVLRVIAEHFALDAVAGKGATGSVYSARDLRTGEHVAVKVLLGGRIMFPRFDREAEVLALLHHPRIVRYVAHGETPAGEAFLAMEWLDGETLQKRIDRGPLTPIETIDAARAIAEALVAAHAAGVIHRDLKPANVVLVGNAIDRLKVVDFGIARAASGPALTASDEIVGTPAYMSPEQARSSRDIDAKSDLFSLGSILYRCIAGVYPFAADGAVNILVRLTTERAAPLASVVPSAPPGLSALVDALLEPDPRARPASAAHVHASLSALRAQLVETTSRVGPAVFASTSRTSATPAVVAAPVQRRKLGALYAGIFGLGVVALLGVAGLWAFTLGPFASSVPRRRTPKAVAVASDCPEAALECARIDIPDPTHVDPFALAPAVNAMGARLGGGEIAYIKTDALGANGVDLTGGGSLEFRLTKQVYVTLRGNSLIATSAPSDLLYRPLRSGPCGLKEAYLAAVASGISPDGPWAMRIADEGDGPGYTFWGPRDIGLITIMASDCKVGTTTLRSSHGD